MVKRKLHPKNFFSEEEKDRILKAIQAAEGKTSGEIRVYLERKAKGVVLKRAEEVFERLGMRRTEKRNGVLIYFALIGRQFAIVGDEGIHKKVAEGFWKDVASMMQAYFSEDDFVGGLAAGIQQVGERLKVYFPREVRDINELPDEIGGEG